MIRTQIIMLRMPRILRMRGIFALILILILERNKIIFIITEFVYYKFEIIVIFFFYKISQLLLLHDRLQIV